MRARISSRSGAEGTLLHIQGQDPVDRVGGVTPAPGEPCSHGVGFGAEAADVEHAQTVAAPRR